MTERISLEGQSGKFEISDRVIMPINGGLVLERNIICGVVVIEGNFSTVKTSFQELFVLVNCVVNWEKGEF